MFTYGVIDGIRVRDLKKYVDERGWLTEIFREDEIETQYMPVMAYISMTGRGTARGPHEHADQTDHFCFLGPSTFKVYLARSQALRSRAKLSSSAKRRWSMPSPLPVATRAGP